MKLININPVTKNRVKQMILGLFPEFGYVRITNSGLLILKTKWYSFKSERVPITDVCIREIPKRISIIAQAKGLGTGYRLMFTQTISSFVESGPINNKLDIVAYIWKQYQSYCIEIPFITKSSLVKRKVNYLPVRSLPPLLPIHAISVVLHRPLDNSRNIIKEFIEKLKNQVMHWFYLSRPQYRIQLHLTT